VTLIDTGPMVALIDEGQGEIHIKRATPHQSKGRLEENRH
jgi:hypothetical protein